MSTIGLDCEIIIDKPGLLSQVWLIRCQTAAYPQSHRIADGGASYIDLGPGCREWSMLILCINDLLKYDGTSTGKTGQQYCDSLYSSYTGSRGTIITFTDPLNGTAIPVHFDSYEERIRDLHTQIIALVTGGNAGASYEVQVVLVEA